MEPWLLLCVTTDYWKSNAQFVVPVEVSQQKPVAVLQAGTLPPQSAADVHFFHRIPTAGSDADFR